jgi:heptosyltransferase-3
MSATAAPRVLVIRGGALGDFILTLPAIRLLREGIPGCRLEILGYPAIAQLAVAAGLADSAARIEHGSLAPLFAPGASIAENAANHLKSFQLVVSYLYDPDGIFAANLRALGVKTLLECPHRVQPDAGHAIEQLARPLERIGFFLENRSPDLSRLRGDTNGWSPPASSRPLVVLHPGSGSAAKTWDLNRWLEVLQGIATGRQGEPPQFVIILGETERERGVEARLREPGWRALQPEVWSGLSVTTLAARLAATAASRPDSLFCGHDTGVAHLAAACGMRGLLLFGPTDPGVWAPVNPSIEIITAPRGSLEFLPVQPVLRGVHQALAPSPL